MDLLALLPVFLLGLGLLWALWLIFKRNMLDQNLTKLISYFLGVIITFAVIGWLMDIFLPRWTAQRLLNARASSEVQVIESVGREIWREAMGDTAQPQPITIITQPPTQPTAVPVTPAPTQSPVAPETNTGGTTITGQAAAQLQPGENYYTVASGDTLYRISQRFGVNWQLIQQRNNLPNTDIRIGQILIIPAK